MLEKGMRVRLTNDVERYPHFIASKGMLGSIVHVDADMISVRMDEKLPGAEEWSNEVHFHANDPYDSAMADAERNLEVLPNRQDFVRHDAIEEASDDRLRTIIADGGPAAVTDAARDELSAREITRAHQATEDAYERASTLEQESPTLGDALTARGLRNDLMHTGGGMHVRRIWFGDGREVWLSREKEWYLGFYDFGTDDEDEGRVVVLATHSDDDANVIADAVLGILRRLRIVEDPPRVTIVLEGPDAEKARDEIGQALEDLRDSGNLQFFWT